MKKRTRHALERGFSHLVPFLLCLLLLILAFQEQDAQQETVGETATPASMEIPFTRLAVENRLKLKGLTWKDENVTLSQGEYGGKLTCMEKEGELFFLSYEMETLKDASVFQGQPEYFSLLSQQKQDAATAQTVYTAVVDALSPATGLTQKQKEQGAEKLTACLLQGKSYSYEAKGWGFSFSFEDQDSLRTVTFTLHRLQEG